MPDDFQSLLKVLDRFHTAVTHLEREHKFGESSTHYDEVFDEYCRAEEALVEQLFKEDGESAAFLHFVLKKTTEYITKNLH